MPCLAYAIGVPCVVARGTHGGLHNLPAHRVSGGVGCVWLALARGRRATGKTGSRRVPSRPQSSMLLRRLLLLLSRCVVAAGATLARRWHAGQHAGGLGGARCATRTTGGTWPSGAGGLGGGGASRKGQAVCLTIGSAGPFSRHDSTTTTTINAGRGLSSPKACQRGYQRGSGRGGRRRIPC